MTDTVRSYSQYQALLANNTSEDIDPQDVRDAFASVVGAYCMLENTGVDKDVVLVSSALVEAGSNGGGTAWTGVNANSDTLTGSASTGRITIGSDTKASGQYIIAWGLRMLPNLAAASPAYLPDTLVIEPRKNWASVVSTGTSLGCPDQTILGRPFFAPADGAPFSASLTAYVPGRPNRCVVTDLLTMAATAVTGVTDMWNAIDVVNLGAAGTGTDSLFASQKSTQTSAISAGIQKAFTFDTATASRRQLAANDVLKVTATKAASPANLQFLGVRGYEQPDSLFMHGFTIADLVGGTDVVSMIGTISQAAGVGTYTAKNGYLFVGRRK